MQIFMAYWNFEYTHEINFVIALPVVKVGGGIDPATEVTHFGLK